MTNSHEDKRERTFLIVGRDPVAKALHASLVKAGHEVELGDADHAAAAATAVGPDVLVLCGDAARDGGARVISMLTTQRPAPRIVVLARSKTGVPESATWLSWMMPLGEVSARLVELARQTATSPPSRDAMPPKVEAPPPVTSRGVPKPIGGPPISQEVPIPPAPASTSMAPQAARARAAQGQASSASARVRPRTPTLRMIAPVSIAALDAPARVDSGQTSQPEATVPKAAPKFPPPERAPRPYPVLPAVEIEVHVATDPPAPATVQAASSRELPQHHEAAFFAQLSASALRMLVSWPLEPLSKVFATRLRVVALVLGAITVSSTLWLMSRGSSSSSIAHDLRPSRAIGALASNAAPRPDQHETSLAREQRPPVPAPGNSAHAPAEPQRAGIAARAAGSGAGTSEKQQQLERAKHLVETAMWQQRGGRLAQAEASYLSALKAWPTYGPAMVGITRVYLQRKNGAEAIRWAKQLSALHPSEGHYALLLGDAYALHGERAQAEQAWKRAARLGNAVARNRLR